MAILGKNLGPGARSDQTMISGNTAAVVSSGSGKFLCAAARTSKQLDEFSVTVANCHGAATTTTGIEIIQLRAMRDNYSDGVGGTLLLTATIPSGTAIGSELTTRDGTLAWASAYANAADRVFQKGTIFLSANDAGSEASDIFILNLASKDFGAPPA